MRAPTSKPITRAAQSAAWVFVVIPIAGLAATIVALVTGPAPAVIHWPVAFVLFLLSTFGIELGFHRLYSHRAYKTTRPIEAFLAIAGTTSAQGSLLFWTELHRRHHPNADREGDPHSPRPQSKGPFAALGGFWHAHTGWMFSDLNLESLKNVPDILRNPLAMRVDRWYVRIVVLSVLAPALIGGLATGTWLGALHGFLIGGLARICLAQHVTYCINSVCHVFGKAPFQCGDLARNVPWVAMLTAGAGWHNNHHAFPSSARTDLLSFELDLGGLVLRTLARLGLAWDLVLPTPAMINAKRKPERT